MGGLFILAIGIAAAALSGGLDLREGWLVLLAVVAMAAVGLADDLLKFRKTNALGLRSLPKLIIALAIGAAVGILAEQGNPSHRLLLLPWASHSVDLGWLWIPFSMLVTAGCAHAVNLTDGMDGLAVGCVAVVLAVLGFLVLRDPAAHVLLPWCASFCGVCVGFLWFNGYPASIFLGDVGALGLGAAVAVISLLSGAGLILMVIGAVFVVEAVSVMLQVASYKWRSGKRIFRVAPIHHHFHLGGITEPKLIIRFWIASVLLAALGLTAVR